MLIYILLILIGIIFYLVVTTLRFNILKNKFRKNIQKINNVSINRKYKIKKNLDIPIYYINLDRSTKRRKYFEEFIQEHDIKNISRVEAMDGKDINTNIYTFSNGEKIKFNIDDFTDCDTKELSTTISHLMAMKKSYENQDEYCLILEDDVYLNSFSLLKEKLSDITEKEQKDIIQIFSTKSTKKENFIKPSSGVVAMLYSRKALELFSNLFKDNKIDLKNFKYKKMTSDYFIFEFARKHNLDSVFYKNIIFPNNLDLETTVHSSGLYDYFNHTMNHIQKSYKISKDILNNF